MSCFWKDLIRAKCEDIPSDAVGSVSGPLIATGANWDGELGVGDAVTRTSFVSSGGSYLFKKLAPGTWHTLALTSDGDLLGTGYQSEGRLGNGASGQIESWIVVATNVKDVVTGDHHSFYIDNNGDLYATGHNVYGQLGTGDNTTVTNWTKIMSGLSSLPDSLGFNSSLVIVGDTLMGTGRNTSGQLGLGDKTNRNVFTTVGSGYAQLDGGRYFTVVIKTDGSVEVCGEGGTYATGLNSTTDITNLIAPPTLNGVIAVDVACGQYHSVIVDDAGQLWVAGHGGAGQVGLGVGVWAQQWTLVPGTTGFVNVAAGEMDFGYTLALKSNGEVWGVGSNDNGQLGLGALDPVASLTLLASNGVGIAAEGNNTFIITE